MAAGPSDDQHDEEKAEPESTCCSREPQTSDQVSAAAVAPRSDQSGVLTRSLSPPRRETFITVPSFPLRAQEEEEPDIGTPARLDLVQGDGPRGHCRL